MPQKHEIYQIFYSFSKVFAENFIKNILLEMKNGLSLRQQQLQVIMSVADKTNAHTPQKRTILLFFFNSKRYTEDTEIFPSYFFEATLE